MKSFLIVILFTSISASFLESRFLFDNIDTIQTRQPGCTNVTYLGIGQACRRASPDTQCSLYLDCVTTNGGSAYTCQFITPSTTCSSDSDCGSSDCRSGKCSFGLALPGQSCSTNSDCASNQCSSKTCLALSSGVACTSHLTCAKGLFCTTSPDNSGVCSPRIANGGACTTYSKSVDSELVCATGSCLTYSYDSTGGVCTAIASATAGVTFIGDPSLCASDTYIMRNTDGTYTCMASAPRCNNPSSCLSISAITCKCPSSGAGNGMCTALTCKSQADNAYQCLYASDFGTNGYYNALYTDGQCSSQIKSYQCCLIGNSSSSLLPSGYCDGISSSVMIAPMLALVVVVIALAL